MKRLLIAGAGGFGREVYEWVCDIQAHEKKWDFVGFLDDDVHSLDRYNLSSKIISTIEEYSPKENDLLICAIADPKIKLEICKKLLDRGAKFTNIIHPTAKILRNSQIGDGVVICPEAIVCINANVGNFVAVDSFSIVGHDSNIGNGCTITCHCNIMGNTVLEEGVFLGGSAVILPKVKIGRYAKVGAASVVINNVKENISVFGNPARKIY